MKEDRFACVCCVEVFAVLVTFIQDLPLLGTSLYMMHFTNLTPCQDKDSGHVSAGTLVSL